MDRDNNSYLLKGKLIWDFKLLRILYTTRTVQKENNEMTFKNRTRVYRIQYGKFLRLNGKVQRLQMKYSEIVALDYWI